MWASISGSGPKFPWMRNSFDERGKSVRLSDYVHDKPVILVMAYYRCPMLCTQVLNGLAQGMLDMSFDAGKEFNVVTVSFDPREKPALAAAKKETYIGRYRRPGAAGGWHFLTGKEPDIRRLAQSIGFRYHYDPETAQYAHAAGIVILTPKGKVSRYFYDVHYSGRDLRLGLVEASANTIGSPVDQVLLFCFHYDPSAGKYDLAVLNFVRLGGVVTMLALILFFGLQFRRERRAARMAGAFDGIARCFARDTSGLPHRGSTMNHIAIFPAQASTTAQSVDHLLIFMVAVCGSMGLLVASLLIYFSIRYRRRPGQVGTPPETPSSRKLEWFWTLSPLVFFVAMFVWGANVYFDAYRAPRRRDGRLRRRQAVDVEVPASRGAARDRRSCTCRSASRCGCC